MFRLHAEYDTAGDQQQAIDQLVEQLEAGQERCVLLGITGSGKTFAMAKVIERLQIPTLILSHNKTLARQLWQEMSELFPENAVEYFVSYYDYYQPEAYLPTSDTFIEKDSSVNDEIDRLRHSTTASLLTRRDTIVVASVSCIYGLGSPEHYEGQLLVLEVGQEVDHRATLGRLIDMHYERNDMVLERGRFRVKGDTLEIHPAYEKTAFRISLFGDLIEAITEVDPLTGDHIRPLDELVVFPATHYMADAPNIRRAIVGIEAELADRLAVFEADGRLLEAQRLRMRTEYDLEMLAELGYCNGVENYSMHLDGRSYGDRPYTLLDYFPDDFLVVLDESHVAVPQLHGQYAGDRSRKKTLVEHGFRLPSAADNRPLTFEEFIGRVGQVVFLSATPGAWELEASSRVVEQIVRPTGLIDPEVMVRPTKGQIDDLLEMISQRVEAQQRVLVTTLTKKMAEDLTDYLLEQGVRVRYLHSDVDTVQRIEILRDLRLGEFDVLVGINLLREGLDLPEVSLVAILDADKEGFLRSETSLVQTIGRAARNVDGEVVMYADSVTPSMQRAIGETMRRRSMQEAYNLEHGIDPQTIRKAVSDILEMIRPGSKAPTPAGRRRRTERLVQDFASMGLDDLQRLLSTLEQEMGEAAADLRFEYAASLRDEIREIERELRDLSEAV
ncbi:MAG TPA: excinuclease ABC subunit B [Acidimicrobiaceae bacterium]|nr:excinuclease ABC subunit B [Acidimicrobiaceae bacterium]